MDDALGAVGANDAVLETVGSLRFDRARYPLAHPVAILGVDALQEALKGVRESLAVNTKNPVHLVGSPDRIVDDIPLPATEVRDALGIGQPRLAFAQRLLIPDRRGNNRIDTLRNLVADPRISLLFLIPGVGETLRINGRAEIATDPELCESFTLNGKAPVSVLVVTAERVYFQCPKALV